MTKWLHFHFSLSCIGEGNGKPLQHSCLENSINRGAWEVHGITKNWMRLSDFHFTIQFSHSVMSNSLWLHGLEHAILPYPSLTPSICSNSCPSSQWCYPTISPSVIPFSFCLQSFPASGYFLLSQRFTSGGQSILLNHKKEWKSAIIATWMNHKIIISSVIKK